MFVREAGAIDNAAYRAINRTDTLQASVHLRRLRDLQILEMKGAGNRTYYVPNHWPDLEVETDPHQVTGDPHQPDLDPHQVTADPHQVAGDPRQPGPDPRQAEPEDSALPGDPAARVAEAGLRPRRDKIRELIRALCAWRPLSARALARFLSDRDQKELVRTHLTPMVETGELALTIPEMANHPDQKYQAAGVLMSELSKVRRREIIVSDDRGGHLSAAGGTRKDPKGHLVRPSPALVELLAGLLDGNRTMTIMSLWRRSIPSSCPRRSRPHHPAFFSKVSLMTVW